MMMLGVSQATEPRAGGVASVDLSLMVGAAVLIALALFGFIIFRELRSMSGSGSWMRRTTLVAQVGWLTYAAWHIIDVSAGTPRWQERTMAVVLGAIGFALFEGLTRVLRPNLLPPKGTE